MPVLSSTYCLKCQKIYDDEKRKMCTGTCHHSICEQCFNRRLSSICPVCEKVNAFEEKNINWQAIQVMKTLKDTSSLSKLADIKFDFETLTRGPCSECKSHSNKLRICADCSKKTLLMHSENGHLEMSAKTCGELLETKILRIKSTAVCSDCALDGNHKGHNVIFIKDIKKLKETSETLNLLTFIALSIHNIESENSVHYKNELRLFNLYIQMFEGIEKVYKFFDNERTRNSEMDREALFLSKLFLGGLETVITKSSRWSTKKLLLSAEKIESTESADEKREWQKTAQKVKKLHDSITSRTPQYEITANDIVHVYNMYQDGFFGKFFSSDINTEPTDIKKEMREAYDMTQDVRRTFEISSDYGKYVNFAGSCIQLLFGEDTSLEELDFD